MAIDTLSQSKDYLRGHFSERLSKETEMGLYWRTDSEQEKPKENSKKR